LRISGFYKEKFDSILLLYIVKLFLIRKEEVNSVLFEGKFIFILYREEQMDFDEDRNRVYLLHLENGERLADFFKPVRATERGMKISIFALQMFIV
jgi:hypothetical protein